MIASGIRVGTPSVTTQGMREGEMRQVAELIARAVAADHETDPGRAALAEVAEAVADLVAKFPVYLR
jgi:glycine hydroxymethyltransferase